jgi:hypothetical protein
VVPHNVNSYFLPCMVVLSAAQLGVYNRLDGLVTLEIWDNKCKSLSFLGIVLWFSNFHVFSPSVLKDNFTPSVRNSILFDPLLIEFDLV